MKIVEHIIHIPLMKKNCRKKNTQTFSQSIFLRDNQKGNIAITGTIMGYIIVWDVCKALCKEGEVKTDRRKILWKLYCYC